MSGLPVVVVGSGGHAKVVIDALLSAGRRVLFATDPDAGSHGRTILGVTVAGGDDALWRHEPSTVEVALGMAVPEGDVAQASSRRLRIIRDISGRGYRMATVIHPSAIISKSAALGEGCQIMAGAIIQPDCRLGSYTILNTRASVDHDCRIGDNVHLAPGVVLGGGITISNDAHLGLGAVIAPGVSIGAGSVIAAGAVVLRNVEQGQRVAGIPAKRF